MKNIEITRIDILGTPCIRRFYNCLHFTYLCAKVWVSMSFVRTIIAIFHSLEFIKLFSGVTKRWFVTFISNMFNVAGNVMYCAIELSSQNIGFYSTNALMDHELHLTSWLFTEFCYCTEYLFRLQMCIFFALIVRT